MLVYTHLLLLLQPSVPWLCIVTFNNYAKPAPKWILWELDVSRIQPRLGGLPHLEMFTWQNVTLAVRVSRSGRPGYPLWRSPHHVNAIKIKWEVIWTGGLPQLIRLPHLPGVPHLHVNRGPFLERPGNFPGPKSNIQVEIKRVRARVLAKKLLHFVSWTDSFIMLDAKLLKPRSLT